MSLFMVFVIFLFILGANFYLYLKQPIWNIHEETEREEGRAIKKRRIRTKIDQRMSSIIGNEMKERSKSIFEKIMGLSSNH